MFLRRLFSKLGGDKSKPPPAEDEDSDVEEAAGPQDNHQQLSISLPSEQQTPSDVQPSSPNSQSRAIVTASSPSAMSVPQSYLQQLQSPQRSNSMKGNLVITQHDEDLDSDDREFKRLSQRKRNKVDHKGRPVLYSDVRRFTEYRLHDRVSVFKRLQQAKAENLYSRDIGGNDDMYVPKLHRMHSQIVHGKWVPGIIIEETDGNIRIKLGRTGKNDTRWMPRNSANILPKKLFIEKLFDKEMKKLKKGKYSAEAAEEALQRMSYAERLMQSQQVTGRSGTKESVLTFTANKQNAAEMKDEMRRSLLNSSDGYGFHAQHLQQITDLFGEKLWYAEDYVEKIKPGDMSEDEEDEEEDGGRALAEQKPDGSAAGTGSGDMPGTGSGKPGTGTSGKPGTGSGSSPSNKDQAKSKSTGLAIKDKSPEKNFQLANLHGFDRPKDVDGDLSSYNSDEEQTIHSNGLIVGDMQSFFVKVKCTFSGNMDELATHVQEFRKMIRNREREEQANRESTVRQGRVKFRKLKKFLFPEPPPPRREPPKIVFVEDLVADVSKKENKHGGWIKLLTNYSTADPYETFMIRQPEKINGVVRDEFAIANVMMKNAGLKMSNSRPVTPKMKVVKRKSSRDNILEESHGVLGAIENGENNLAPVATEGSTGGEQVPSPGEQQPPGAEGSADQPTAAGEEPATAPQEGEAAQKQEGEGGEEQNKPPAEGEVKPEGEQVPPVEGTEPAAAAATGDGEQKPVTPPAAGTAAAEGEQAKPEGDGAAGAEGGDSQSPAPAGEGEQPDTAAAEGEATSPAAATAGEQPAPTTEDQQPPEDDEFARLVAEEEEEDEMDFDDEIAKNIKRLAAEQELKKQEAAAKEAEKQRKLAMEGMENEINGIYYFCLVTGEASWIRPKKFNDVRIVQFTKRFIWALQNPETTEEVFRLRTSIREKAMPLDIRHAETTDIIQRLYAGHCPIDIPTGGKLTVVGDVEEGAKLFGMPLDNLTQRAEAYEKKLSQQNKFGTTIGARTMGASTSTTAVGFKPPGETTSEEQITYRHRSVNELSRMVKTNDFHGMKMEPHQWVQSTIREETRTTKIISFQTSLMSKTMPNKMFSSHDRSSKSGSDQNLSSIPIYGRGHNLRMLNASQIPDHNSSRTVNKFDFRIDTDMKKQQKELMAKNPERPQRIVYETMEDGTIRRKPFGEAPLKKFLKSQTKHLHRSLSTIGDEDHLGATLEQSMLMGSKDELFPGDEELNNLLNSSMNLSKQSFFSQKSRDSLSPSQKSAGVISNLEKMRGASSDEGGVSDPFGMSGLMNFGNETTEMNDKMYQKIAEAERVAREKQKQKQLEEENKMNQTASSGFGKFISKRRQSRSKSVSRLGSEEGGELFDSALLDSQELFDDEDNDKTFLFTSKDDMEACNLHDRLYIRGDKFSKPTGETTKTDFSYKKVVRNWGYMDVKEQAELPHFKAGLKQMTGVKEDDRVPIQSWTKTYGFQRIGRAVTGQPQFPFIMTDLTRNQRSKVLYPRCNR